MNMFNFKFFKKALVCVTLCISGCLTTSCVDDIPEENRFTFTGELISDHLENNAEYSKFVTILKKANISKKAVSSLFKTLSTYGSYTCFAPTNEAVDAFLAEKAKDPTSGYTSDVESLSQEIATEIAKNHIIERSYKFSETPDGDFPKVTMNRRSVSFKTTANGILLEEESKVIKSDIETENGVIQVIDKVLDPSSLPLYEQMRKYPNELGIFADAIEATNLHNTLLNKYEELEKGYEGNVKSSKRIEAQGDAYSPVERRQRYTILVETDELFKKHGITDVTTLHEFVAQFYEETEAEAKDFTNPNNALHKFVLYHIIDRQLSYTGGPGGFIMENFQSSGFNSEINLPTTHDRTDYFETMLPYTMIKVTRPFTNSTYERDIVINYAQENGELCNNPDMKNHINVVVQRKEDSGIEKFNQKALNGTLHTIDKILIYNEEEMSGNILNERMRWDISSLFPEWTNNGVRWEENSKQNTTYIPNGYSERLEINGVVDNTVILYLRPRSTGVGGYANYMGDELLAIGRYDFKYRIPHVPEGTYEIRFGYSVSNLRSITQFYYDTEICGIPVDMSIGGKNAFIGWEDDEEQGGEAQIKELDKAMRNRGYMKGPASCILEEEESKSMRRSDLALRRIVGTFKITKGDHWLRFKNVKDSEKNEGGEYYQFNQDYLEIVPTNIISNQAKPEDQN